jgi:hypothetical protein
MLKMKKKIFIASMLLNALFNKTFAATGNASDGFEGALVIIGFLLLITGLLYARDYFKKNGKKVIRKVFTYLKVMIKAIGNRFNNAMSEYYNQIYLS